MKKCKKCGEVKAESDFYRQRKGTMSSCKECVKEASKVNRRAKSDYYKNYDAWRYQNDPRVKARHKRYSKTDSGAKALRSGKKAWINRNPDARAAHIILGNAVKAGRIYKPENCSCCGKFTPSMRLHAHHHDYSLPLDVTWLCVDCHKAVHNN